MDNVFLLSVLDPPEIIQLNPAQDIITVNQSNNLAVVCSVRDRGYPPGNITWQLTNSSSDIFTSASSSAILNLLNISALQNSNLYICSIDNGIGHLSIKFSLKVQGKHIKTYLYNFL